MSVGSFAHGELQRIPEARRRTRWGVHALGTPAALVGLTALGAALRFYGIGHQGYWFDEANTALLVRFPPGKMLGLIPRSESTPPLYYCIAWVWARLFGSAETGLRSLSALAGVAVVPVAYAATRALATCRAALVVTALTACNPLLIWYSQEARSYELLVLFCAVALAGFAAARADPTPPRIALWTAACVLALATHYFALVAVVPQACWLLVEHRRRPAVALGVAVVAVCGLALIPLAVSQSGTGHDAWIAHTPLGPRLAQIVPQYLIGTGAPVRMLLKFVAMACALAGLVLLGWRADQVERDGARVAGTLVVGGFVLSLAFVVIGFDELITRNLIALWLPVAIVVGLGLGARRARRVGVALTVILCLVGVTATVGVAADRTLQRPDWRLVARALGPVAPAGQPRAILIQHYLTLLPLSLYLPHLQVMRRTATVDRLDVISIRSPQQPLCWWGAACNLVPSRMQASYPIRGFRTAWQRRVRQFTIRQLVAPAPLRLTRTAVAQALTATELRHDLLVVQRP